MWAFLVEAQYPNCPWTCRRAPVPIQQSFLVEAARKMSSMYWSRISDR